MSLINEMLRDLEARGGNEPDAQIRSAPESRAQRRSVWPLVALGLITLGVFAAVLSSRPAHENDGVLVAQPSPLENRSAPIHQEELPAVQEAAALSPIESAHEIPPAETAQIQPDVTTEAPVPEPVVVPAPNSAVAPVLKREPKLTEGESVFVRRHEPTAEEVAARAGRDGFAALRNGNWATAARLLQELVAFEPANDDAREGLAAALTRQGRIAEADATLIDGMALATVPARFAKLRARLQAGRGELDAALASLSIAVPGVSSDPEYHALRAALAQQAKRYDVAATTYSALTAFEPANATWLAGLGMALDMLGDSGGALDAYKRALSSRQQLDAALLEHVQRRMNALSDQEK